MKYLLYIKKLFFRPKTLNTILFFVIVAIIRESYALSNADELIPLVEEIQKKYSDGNSNLIKYFLLFIFNKGSWLNILLYVTILLPILYLKFIELKGKSNSDDKKQTEILNKLTELHNKHMNSSLTTFQDSIMDEIGISYEEASDMINTILNDSTSLRELGLAYYFKKEYEKSEKYLDQAFQKNPSKFDACSIDSLFHSYSKNNNSIGLNMLIDILSHKNFNFISTSLYSALGGVAIWYKRINEGEKLVNKSLKLDNNNVQSLIFLAVIKQQRNQIDESIKLLEKAIRIDSSNKEAKDQMLNSLQKIGKYDESIALAEQYEKDHPEHYYYPYKIGAALTDSNSDLEEAVRQFDKAGQLTESTLVHGSKAKALLKMNRFEESLLTINEAINLKPKNIFHYQTRALVYHTMGEENLAQQDLALVDKIKNENSKAIGEISATDFEGKR